MLNSICLNIQEGMCLGFDGEGFFLAARVYTYGNLLSLPVFPIKKLNVEDTSVEPPSGSLFSDKFSRSCRVAGHKRLSR
jgi:hypothetical protein